MSMWEKTKKNAPNSAQKSLLSVEREKAKAAAACTPFTEIEYGQTQAIQTSNNTEWKVTNIVSKATLNCLNGEEQ